jgi:hypothetical protein
MWKYHENFNIWSTEKDDVTISVFWEDDKYYVDIYYSNNTISIGPYDTLEEAKYAGEQESDFSVLK